VSAVLSLPEVEPRQLTAAETLAKAQLQAKAAAFRITAALLDEKAARIEMAAGEDEVGSGLGLAQLDRRHAEQALEQARRQIAYSQAQIAGGTR
jgi:hypothetical protein